MEVTVNLEVRNDSRIMADPEDMEIIFNNLISNAVKYNKFGGKAEILIDSTDSEVFLIFTDTGIGISEADRENLFREFMRVKNERTKNISGSGLGLSIVRKVIELYHGTIKVDSTPELGTVFTVRLPRKQLNIS
jgi:signal transduction histidine kinase